MTWVSVTGLGMPSVVALVGATVVNTALYGAAGRSNVRRGRLLRRLGR